jgi:bacitracin synthase 3
VGWFTSVYPLVVEGISGDSRHDIRLVKETFRAVPNKGLGYGILQYIESAKGDDPLRTDLMPLIGFNYLGQMEESRDGDLLTLASEITTGQAVATENASFAPSVDINCIVEGGTFHAGLSYDTAVWTDSQARALADAFINRLQAIADHTSKVTVTEPTASDIGAEGWTDEQYQAITDRFAARGEHLRRVYPLTPMQDAMLLEYLKDTGTTAYRLVFRYAVDTLPTEQALRDTMDWLAERHETLRTGIIYEGVQEPCQAIVDRSLPVAFIDLTGEPDIDDAAARIHRELQHRPLSL